MTVMVVLDAKQDLNEVLMPRRLTRRELIGLTIVHSDNNAAKLLCDNYPGGPHDCVQAMNLKASELGMHESKFIEPTGLSVFNVSTAQDLVKLVLAASKYSIINEDSNKNVIRIPANKKKSTQFHNTNSLVGQYDFKVSKTGWINKSGGCIVMMIDTNNSQKIVVLLGSKNTHTRIPEAKMIALAY
jgi:D-alanyl-D-alanine endopeptidase (penicillin-binding protein 7)